VPKAKTIAEGAHVRIVGVSFSKSRYTQIIQKGPNAGQERPRYQLRVDLKPLPDGETAAQFLGGVYPKDYDDLAKGYTLTPDGGAFAFVASLKEAGVVAALPDSLKDFAGIEFIATHVKDGVGKLASDHIRAKGPVTKTAAGVTAPPVVATATTPVVADAYTALSQGDRDAIVDALKAGPVAPADLVEAGIAKDTAHAEAILSAAPKKTNPLHK
jgi:hypothetical protein